MANVRIGDILFEEWPHNYERCFLIGRNGLKGWRGGDLRREEIHRPAAHGAFDMAGYQVQRVISLSGTLLADSPIELRHMKDSVVGLLADGSSGQMTVEDADGETWRDVRLVSSSEPEDLDRCSATFDLTFWAADPRRYGEVREFPGGVPSVHFGNFSASPRLLVGPGSGGYAVNSSNGGRIFVQSSAPSGAHVLDLAAGGLFLDGVRQVGVTTTWRPWVIPPGSPGVVASMQGSSRSLVQQVTDTFV